ncbi:MAG: hypothetical protein NC038_05410 [Paludibacter sp.]|nr:hypothetical protein [Bacteroidales bacterium]MCM1069808.1 hypothetical protein [Prevotella sp.]MCM1353998.1 hypothetical protein [Bacteroides sp.]MCM1443360.1 hypothetical protein [Muribaculum sp.]MCM1482063.1 hypothetical protein [Paludibacter sp.]
METIDKKLNINQLKQQTLMKVIKGVDLQKLSKGQATPAKRFMVDQNDPNIKQCQSWNDYIMYQIKGQSKSGKTYATYEIVKVMRKRKGHELQTL